jgi:hypothetical protein
LRVPLVSSRLVAPEITEQGTSRVRIACGKAVVVRTSSRTGH